MERTAVSPWNDILGPCLTTRPAAELMGVSLAELDRRRRRGQVLGVQTRSRRWVYPAAQFQADGASTAATSELQPVLAALLEAADGLAAARWMASPNARLSGRTPWEALRDEPDAVVAAAERQARAWTGQT